MQFKTSTANKAVVTDLTNKFLLGTENIIARIAIAYSLQSGEKLDVLKVEDAGGKEYSQSVLFGSYYDIYVAMICSLYDIPNTDKDISRYLKMHLDDGLERIAKDVKDNPNLVGYDYLFDKIQDGLEAILC